MAVSNDRDADDSYWNTHLLISGVPCKLNADDIYWNAHLDFRGTMPSPEEYQ